MSQTKIPVVVYSEIFYPKVSVSRTRVIPVKFVEDAVETPTPVLSTSVTRLAESLAPKRSVFKIWRSRLGALTTFAVAAIALVLVGTKIAGFKTFTVMSGAMSASGSTFATETILLATLAAALLAGTIYLIHHHKSNR
ncbi:hypothetical protein IIZ77_00195 [Candidatus Saccharibacteria bacterium]|nr:hypothetical protein [Candidatus Saccharibacteria bacterium]